MGCDGCELWNRKAGVKLCYAGTLTDRRRGAKGFPAEFEKPVLFPERLAPALRWRDLTGTKRPDKPWLDGLPRIIFLNDMGDTFTESLPIDWLAPHLPLLAGSPHQWLVLTKRPKRMAEFSQRHPLPPNVWPGASVTSAATVSRVDDLLEVRGGGVRWLSVEPLVSAVDFSAWLRPGAPQLGWLVVGGESGSSARPFDLEWAQALIGAGRAASVPVFIKQIGKRPRQGGEALKLKDAKGGDMAEWPTELRVRMMPKSAPG
jgi:protein gp37